MGYTHYWKMTEPLVIQPLQKKLIEEVLKSHSKVLAGGGGEYNTRAKLTDKLLSFNGIRDFSHETFHVEFGTKEEFSFCKTAQKPYDLAVCKCLLILSLSDGFSFSSDGDKDDWKEALAWFSEQGFNDTLNKKIMPYFNGN